MRANGTAPPRTLRERRASRQRVSRSGSPSSRIGAVPESSQDEYCEHSPNPTYNGVLPSGERMQGGYSTRIVVDEKFVLSIAAKDRLDAVAPLLCAGITTWSPLRHWKVGKGQRVAVN